jgi:hypothetical protein
MGTDSRGLREVGSPEGLHSWMEKNLSYGLRPGREYRSAEEVASTGRTSCWGAADFAAARLAAMGFETNVVFVCDSTAAPRASHSAAIFSSGKEWYWFEWSWRSMSGIRGPFPSAPSAAGAVSREFLDSHGLRRGVSVRHDGPIGRPGIGDGEYLRLAMTGA